ncbi:MAG: hypothetical protein R3B13_18855 [Polyangiaceae bacterium]
MTGRKLASLIAGLAALAVLPNTAHALQYGSWHQQNGCATWLTQRGDGIPPSNVYIAGCESGADKKLYQGQIAGGGGTGWLELPGLTAVQISAWDSGSIWARRSNGTVHYRTASGWSGPVSFGGGNACASYIAAAGSNTVYALGCETTPDKSIWWRNTSGNWIQLPGAGKQIGFAGTWSSLYVVTSAFRSWRWTGTTWELLPGYTFQLSTGRNDAYYAQMFDGWIYKWENQNWQDYFPPTPLQGYPTKFFTRQWATDTLNRIYVWDYGIFP